MYLASGVPVSGVILSGIWRACMWRACIWRAWNWFCASVAGKGLLESYEVMGCNMPRSLYIIWGHGADLSTSYEVTGCNMCRSVHERECGIPRVLSFGTCIQICQNHTRQLQGGVTVKWWCVYIELARTIYIRYIYVIFGREITKNTAKIRSYTVYIYGSGQP